MAEGSSEQPPPGGEGRSWRDLIPGQMWLRPCTYALIALFIPGYILDRHGAFVYGRRDARTFARRRIEASASGVEFIIVCGAALRRSGELGITFKRRVEAAVQLYQAYELEGATASGLQVKVVFTGAMEQSYKASRYAIQIGLPSSAVLCENHSTTTYENAYFALTAIEEYSRSGFDGRNDPSVDEEVRPALRERMEERILAGSDLPSGRSVVVLSDTYHMLRCRLLFENFFTDVCPYASYTEWHLHHQRWTMIAREAAGLMKNSYLGRISVRGALSELFSPKGQ